MTAYSYNGWPASVDAASIGVVPFVVAGVPFPGGVKGGDVFTVLHHVAREFHHRVEQLESALRLLLRTDQAIKTGEAEPELALELFIWDLPRVS